MQVGPFLSNALSASKILPRRTSKEAGRKASGWQRTARIYMLESYSTSQKSCRLWVPRAEGPEGTDLLKTGRAAELLTLRSASTSGLPGKSPRWLSWPSWCRARRGSTGRPGISRQPARAFLRSFSGTLGTGLLVFNLAGCPIDFARVF